MGRIFKSQLLHASRFVDIHFTQGIVIRIDIFIYPQTIKIERASHRIDIGHRTGHPSSRGNGMFKITLPVIKIIMSPTGTLRTINNIFPVIQKHDIGHLIVHKRLIDLMNQHFHLSRFRIHNANFLFVKCPGTTLEKDFIAVLRSM